MNTPTVKAHAVITKRAKSTTISLEIICPYCGKKHTHGGGSNPDAIEYGHRLSHCLNAKPNDGYILEGE